jgi:hypothetical protein
LKILILAIIIALVAFAIMPGYTTALEPHENPDDASQNFDGAVLLRQYAWALEFVSLRDIAGLKALIDRTSYANIPPDLKKSMQDFLAANQDLAVLLKSLDIDVETATALVSQLRPEEAQALLKVMEDSLQQANLSLGLAKSKFQETDNRIQAGSAPAESALKKAFDDVVSMLALQSQGINSLSDSVKTISDEVLPPGVHTTSISLTVDPATAYVGDRIGFQGHVTSDAEPLGGRKITILVDGATAADAETDVDGNYRGELAIPYNYVSEMSVEAVYHPEGDDISVYDGSTSPSVTLRVLFYQTNMILDAPKKAYPGQTYMLEGNLDYGNNPMPKTRQVQVYWDDELKTELEVTESFAVELPLPDNTAVGQHLVKVDVAPQQRYAPGSFTAQLEVTKAAVFIDVDAPGMALLPFGLIVSGKVYSDTGPLDGANVNIMLGDWEATTRTADDGTFKVHLNTGMSLTMFGSRNLEVSAVPKESWNQIGEISPSLKVINLVNIFGLALAIAVALFALFRVRKAIKRTPAVGAQPGQATPETGYTAVSQPEAPGSPRSILIELYRQVLRSVQNMTTMMLRSNQTLREFAQETVPRLGPLAGHFKEFTLMMEKTLYSKRPPQEEDVARGEELSKRLQEGAGKQ